MEDMEIIRLYQSRQEAAIEETERKYGKRLLALAMGILQDSSDSEESVNDTYFKTWSSIPPQEPSVFSAWLYKLTRRISIDRYRARKAEKRRATEYSLSLEELNECVAGEEMPEQALELQLLTQTIGAFLRTLSPERRNMFLCRYFFLDSLKQIAGYFDVSEAKVKSALHRTRRGLKNYLEQEGFFL